MFKINYNNQILQSNPASTPLSNINRNNEIKFLYLYMSHDISKQMNCIKKSTKNNCNNNINLILICEQQRNKKDIKIKKMNNKLIKRKNTYTKNSKEKKINIKEKIEISPFL